MRNRILYGLALILCILSRQSAKGQDDHTKGDSLVFRGQVSAWAQYNPDLPLPILSGARYIPQLNYSLFLPKQKMLDAELSANINVSERFRPFDANRSDGYIKPYRAWVRYSASQFELRAGLQKINFGSATMLRPLMWFDKLDPRDPLKLTEGVYGLLMRYYFLNNANIWFWGLYGNEEPKTWETGKTSLRYPEIGGRFQTPVPLGEAGISYHYRVADTQGNTSGLPSYSEVPENRIGLDAKWDVGPGLWIEGTWINKSRSYGMFTNQEIFNAGCDYTFGWGKGLNFIIEQLLISSDRTPFEIRNPLSFTTISLNYPAGLSDTFGAIFYYDWTNNSFYRFVNWKRQIQNFSFYVMAYWNPKVYLIPLQAGEENFFSGKGIQIMFVYNH